MTAPLTVACVQHCADLDTARNVAALRSGIAAAVGARRHASSPYPNTAPPMVTARPACRSGPSPRTAHAALAALRGMAREHAVWLAIGSLGVRADDGRTWNRSYLVDPEGEIRARYDKIHLFDVDLAGGESYRESATIAPGEHAVVAETPLGGLGFSICYDLRFPQLYRALAQGRGGHPAGARRLHPHDRPRPLARAAARAGDRDRLLRRGGLAVRRGTRTAASPATATR